MTTYQSAGRSARIANTPEAMKAEVLQSAAFASLLGSAVTKAARALAQTVFAQVAAYEREHGTHKHKPGSALQQAVGAFLADLLAAQSEAKPGPWVYRSLHAKGFTGAPVGHRVFCRMLEALEGLGLVERAGGVHQFVDFGDGPFVGKRWAARFKATASLLALCEKHGLPPQNAGKHFKFDYPLPKRPLQKRKAKTTNAYTRRQARGALMEFAHTGASQKLDGDVRELNEFLSRQQIEGGTHQGYLRIFQNGDDPRFNWNLGGRLYSQPPAINYQQLNKAKRLKMKLNGEAVAEIDIRASYLTIFHAWYGVQLDFNRDPYLLPRFGEAGRDAVKLWMVATFGSPKPISRWPHGLLKEYEEDHKKQLDRKRYPVALVREKALLQHPLMAEWGQPFKGRIRTWADLMFHESVVMVTTMGDLMKDQGIPSLAVHDSIIVPQSSVEIAAKALKARFKWVTGVEPQLTVRPKGLMGALGP